MYRGAGKNSSTLEQHKDFSFVADHLVRRSIKDERFGMMVANALKSDPNSAHQQSWSRMSRPGFSWCGKSMPQVCNPTCVFLVSAFWELPLQCKYQISFHNSKTQFKELNTDNYTMVSVWFDVKGRNCTLNLKNQTICQYKKGGLHRIKSSSVPNLLCSSLTTEYEVINDRAVK